MHDVTVLCLTHVWWHIPERCIRQELKTKLDSHEQFDCTFSSISITMCFTWCVVMFGELARSAVSHFSRSYLIFSYASFFKFVTGHQNEPLHFATYNVLGTDHGYINLTVAVFR